MANKRGSKYRERYGQTPPELIEFTLRQLGIPKDEFAATLDITAITLRNYLIRGGMRWLRYALAGILLERGQESDARRVLRGRVDNGVHFRAPQDAVVDRNTPSEAQP